MTKDKIWDLNINLFVELANKHEVKMILVGGAAVNFHGYQRHSADVDFWIDTEVDNMNNLLKVVSEMGYPINEFPESVMNQQQNISIKFSPLDLNLELITNFSTNQTFEEVYAKTIQYNVPNNPNICWRILKLEDLIESKIKSGRPKDLLDVLELKRINELD